MSRNKPAKPCKVCSHGERRLIESSLALGQAPRSIARRYADLKRAHIARHREGCVGTEEGAA